MFLLQNPVPVSGNSVIDLATIIAQLPLHAILALGMIAEGYIIKLLWDKMNTLHDKLDECLGVSKEK